MSSCRRSGIPSSRAHRAVTALMLPPAESPPMARRSASTPMSVGVLDDPAQRRRGVVDGGRERVLGCQPVVDGDHDAPAPVGERSAVAIVGVETADHEPAAVVEDQRRRRTGTDLGGAIDPHRQLLAGGVDRAVLGPRRRPRRGPSWPPWRSSTPGPDRPPASTPVARRAPPSGRAGPWCSGRAASAEAMRRQSCRRCGTEAATANQRCGAQGEVADWHVPWWA